MLINCKYLYILLTFLSVFSLHSQEDQQFDIPIEYSFLENFYTDPDQTIEEIAGRESKIIKSGNKKDLINFYLVIGKYFLSHGIYDRAFGYFLEAKEKLITSQLDDNTILAEIENRLGDVSKYRFQNEQALLNYQTSLKLAKENNLKYWQAESYNNIGDMLRYKKEVDKAFSYYDSCYQIAIENNFTKLIGNTYNNLGDLFILENKLDSAKYYLLKSVEIYEKEQNDLYVAENLNSLGEVYLKEDNFENSEAKLLKSKKLLASGTYYAEQIKNLEILDKLYKVSYQLSKRIAIQEELLSIIKLSYRNSLKSNMSALKLNQEISEMKFKNKMLEESKRFDNYLKIGFIILLLILAYVAILIYSKYSQNKKYSELKDKHNLDILAQKNKLEEAFDNINNLNSELKELNATKDRFFSIIAHDLKGPISNLKQLSEILQKEIETISKEDLIDFIESMAISSKATMVLLENLLEWSRIQLGRIEFDPESIELKMLSSQIVSLLSTSAQNKKIELVENVPFSAMVIGDPNMLNTVIRNLVSNAIKFTPEGGKIEINYEEDEDFCTVSIIDNGVGISEENLNKLFKIDQSITTRGTSNEKGTGLGLILCKEFIEKHGGKIWVESVEGKGTTFKFNLPRR
jgi:signal transduction histidine kinase